MNLTKLLIQYQHSICIVLRAVSLDFVLFSFVRWRATETDSVYYKEKDIYCSATVYVGLYVRVCMCVLGLWYWGGSFMESTRSWRARLEKTQESWGGQSNRLQKVQRQSLVGTVSLVSIRIALPLLIRKYLQQSHILASLKSESPEQCPVDQTQQRVKRLVLQVIFSVRLTVLSW